MGNQIEHQAAIDAVRKCPVKEVTPAYMLIDKEEVMTKLMLLPSAQPESTRTFVELLVKYPDPELCAYNEYKGKPYYSIKYIENGEIYIGYGTYNPKVLSQYLKEYFMSSTQKKGYTKADYIMALHKEYGCSLVKAEEAHQRALEYLRNTSKMKG